MIEPIKYALNTVQRFKIGLSSLKVDFLTSLHIQQAEITRQHLLRRSRRDYELHRKKLRSHERHGIHIVDCQSGKEVAFFPSTQFTYPSQQQQQQQQRHVNHQTGGNYLSTRRPQEHLRQISRDLQTTLPTVMAFLVLPGVGYAFLLLGMLFPRVLLSRQFHTRKQRWDFATIEYSDRIRWFDKLSGDFWGSCMICMPSLSYLQMDAAGPVFNGQSMQTIYDLVENNFMNHQQKNSIRSSSIDHLQSTHLHNLALSNNLAASILLPFHLGSTLLQFCLPSIYLRQKLQTLAEDIIMDDAALIEEGQLDSQCGNMTEEEVLDACWLRGLPIGRFATMHSGADASVHIRETTEIEEMRKTLSNQLQMMNAVMRRREKGELVRDTTLQLLVLHLPAIRRSMKQKVLTI